jgi:site-specific DNA recombinase
MSLLHLHTLVCDTIRLMPDDTTGQWWLYLRKSQGRTGIPRQRNLTTAHVNAIGGVVAGENADADRTAYRQPGAARPERPGFDAMLATLRATPGMGIAAWHADRLLRDPGDAELLIEACAGGGHLIETPSGGSYDLSTATGRQRLRADTISAAYEVDHLRERIMAQKAEAAAAGLWLGGARPFGYEGIPAPAGSERRYDGLRIVEDEAALIRSAARAVLQGVSLSSIAADWNAAGITGTGGGRWNIATLGRVLRGPRNAGIAVHNGAETGPGAWEPILAPDTFRALQLVFAGRRNPGYPTARRWLGSGLYLCGVCGAALHTHGGGGPAGCGRTSYGCPGHIARQAAAVDRYVSEFIVAWLEQPQARRVLAAARPPGEDAGLLHDRILVLRGRLEALTAQWMAGDATDGELAAGRAEGRQEIAGLERRVEAAARVSPLSGAAGDSRIREKWPSLPLSRRRAILAAMMDAGVMTARIHPAGSGRPRDVPWPDPWLDEDLIELVPGSRAASRARDEAATAERDARVAALREAGLPYRAIAAETGISFSSARRAVARMEGRKAK